MSTHNNNPTTNGHVDVTLLDPMPSPVPTQAPFADRAPDASALKAVYVAPPMPPVNIRRSVLEEAITVVCGERETTYKGPENSFLDIAELWNAFLNAKQRSEEPGNLIILKPYDVALMMGLMKTARLIASDGKHRDSWVDLAGYAGCGSECGLE
jgi:hypothetical protein